MLESIKIQGFRKYKNINIEGFKNINFILGDNNVGKTTLLEAIYAWTCGNYVRAFINIPLSRGRYGAIQQPYWVMEEILSTVNDRHELPMTFSLIGVEDGKEQRFIHKIYPSELLTEYDSTYKMYDEKFVSITNEELSKSSSSNSFIGGVPTFNPIVVAKWITSDGTNEYEYDITTPYSPISKVLPYKNAKYIDLLSHTAIAENVQMYTMLKREGILEDVLDELRKIYPEIKSVDMFPYSDGSQSPISIVKQDGSILPIYAYGDGVQRWFYIIGAISLYKNSIICIDEMDTGFHFSAQKEFCAHILPYALKNNVQLFITTHNKEFIMNFFDAYKDDNTLEDEVSVYTLKNIEGDLKIRCLNYKESCEMLYSYNKELR